MICLDTNALIRFFTNDQPEKGKKVKKLIESKDEIIIPDVVFHELEYILKKKYHHKRMEINTMFEFLASQPNIKISPEVKNAIVFFGKTTLDMADCCIIASSFSGNLASFDKAMLKAPGVKSYW